MRVNKRGDGHDREAFDMHLDLFLPLTYFVHEQKAPSFVLTQFLGVYNEKSAFDVTNRQMTIALPSWIWGASLRGKQVHQN